MPSDSNVVKTEGLVLEALPGLLFRVRANILGEEKDILAYLAGRLKVNYIRIIPGDRVIVELPSLNDRRGRIIRRL